MPRNGRDEALELVDRVLSDLTWRDGMFVGRRPQQDGRLTVVIQSGEDARYRIARPDPTSPEDIERFMTEAQAHLTEVYGRAVPRCPDHDHALAAGATDGGPAWVCPEDGWRCPLGAYEELTWPPELSAGSMAAALGARLSRRGVTGVIQIGFERRKGDWVATVGVLPMEPDLIDAIKDAAAPVAVDIWQHKGPLPRRVPLRG